MRQSNPGRQKIYLVDVEHAKKEEFERRKKLRLQQVGIPHFTYLQKCIYF